MSLKKHRLKWKDSGNAGLTKETFLACIQSVGAVIELASCLHNQHDVRYILPGKFMSDPIEGRFGWYRQANGGNFYMSVVDTTMDDFVSKAALIKEKALKMRTDTPPWHYLKMQGGVKVSYKASPQFNGNMYKFETTLDFPYDLVYEVMKPSTTTQERLAWDKSIKHYERLSGITEEIAVCLVVTPSVAWGMISKREFVDLYLFKKYSRDEMELNEGESIDFPSRPVTSEYVRGINHPFGYAVAQNTRNPNQCFLELCVNCDIGGMIPRSIVESALPAQQVHYIDSVKAEVKRRLASK